MFTPELLSPAGSLKNMRYAFAYGADAVYAGQPRYSLRVRNNEFDLEKLEIGINEAHDLGKKLYVVSNIAPHNAKLKTYIQDLEPVIKLNPDALIMSDPGLIMMVREAFPDQQIHLSVQANAVNWATVKFWQQQGISRVILSRELSLDEIEEIRLKVPDMELEVFVHGALCMAYSGRCLLSGYMNKRDPNQGACTNACRWQYNAHDAKQDEVGQIIASSDSSTHSQTSAVQIQEPTDQLYLLQERGRPDEYMPAFEDEHGTYIMNSKDLRAIQHVDRLVKMGIHSLKIEGRTKSFYYCARTAQVYRQAISDAVAGKGFNNQLMNTLENLAHRGYTDGFLQRHRHVEMQNYDTGNSISEHQQFVGEVISTNNNALTIEVKNRFSVGDSLELMTPKGNVSFQLAELNDKQGRAIDVAKGSGHIVNIPCPQGIDASMGILLRNLSEGQTTRQPHASKTA
ncbi:tRNA 5-hydroxyuridine modification protein YegQ [Marinomonas sp. GJ51-6]|uniref:prephenate-dependent tRNA uridine(34) hydroxylase TrhP n=1 Tax=Marinomonas sp. GJ51-6 TaxID=2992802 RepID=UPI002934C61F|nr:tRNA 5-hydroxyuridine modification protein YegQ [Marinomonas sp. GJ51-6]WOD08079.1 tRNA 5-hydroxyuridine modification protein YegQ [Marinomonas sp. GJ51-6]